MVCPICNEEMVTLLQLNRHLDDLHQNLEEGEQDEVKTWFKAQMTKAKKFQPLAVLNQKLKGLDVFESNETPGIAVVSSTSSVLRDGDAKASSGNATPTSEARAIDPDDLITKSHWQRGSGLDLCADPICGKRLGGVNGSINCRKCGKLFCEEHTMYQMKLSRSAHHEPVRGSWHRVCETCYKSREGYNDHAGAEQDHTGVFKATRRKTVDKAFLEVSRLEKRLTKLTQLLANPPADASGAGGLIGRLSGNGKAQQRALEQSIISWEEDASVSQCPFCQQEFTNYSFRRHHCRLCGRVVCNDARTNCSTEVGLNVSRALNRASEKRGSGHISLDVRMCKDCRHTIFSKADFVQEVAQKPPDQRAFEHLIQFERGIRLLLPKFQRLLLALQ